MNARIYGRCEVCESAVRLPRKTFRALVASSGRFQIVWLLCRNWEQHPAYRTMDGIYAD